MELSAPTCVQFYYYFFAHTSFAFNVYARNARDASRRDPPLWTRRSSQGSFWKLGRVTVDSAHFSPFNIVMELQSVLMARLDEVFALDDVSLSRGACRDSSDLNEVCMFSSGDNDTCGYTIEPTNFKWLLYQPDLSQIDAGRPLPIFDHTSGDYGSGYVYVNPAGFKPYDRASMVSQLYESDNYNATRCLEFYFYMSGGQLPPVLSVIIANGLLNTTIWMRHYDHGQSWWKANVNVKFEKNYRVAFEAHIDRAKTTASIALDDIVLRDGACSRYV